MTPAPHAALHAHSGCYHCGLPIPHGRDYAVLIDDVSRAMCCAGCQAVAQTIVQHGLSSYYRHRSAMPASAETVAQAVRDVSVYRIAGIEHALTRNDGGDVREAALMFEGITCAACVWLIEQRIARISGVLDIDINYASHRAQVRWDARRTGLAAIIEAVTALGYHAHPYDSARADEGRRGERSRALWRLFVAGFGMMQVMMYLLPVYLTNGEMTADIVQLMRIASLVLTLPVVLYSAAPFFAGAWRDLRGLHVGMDVPIVLGIVAAFAASVVATATGSGAVYFDSVTMFVFLLLAARYLEMTARMRAVMSQERLAQHAPDVAERMAAWPSSDLAEIVPAGVLRTGDHVRVRPGAMAPADGVVVEGESEFDERLLTGESRPQPKHAGDTVTGGAFNIDGSLVMRVTRIGADSVRAAILRLLDRGAGERPQIMRSADRAARHFVLALLVIAAVVAAVWYQLDAARALWVTVAVLVVSCPCALSLATPAALAAASGALHENGVLVTRGDALENLARATDFVFDKTGTLTTGNMRLLQVIALDAGNGGRAADACLDLAAALEAGSAHPVARALIAAAPAPIKYRCSACKPVAGAGVEATVDGVRVRLGTPHFVAALSRMPLPRELEFVPDAVTVAALGDEKGWIALFTFADPLREHARILVRGLADMGRKVHLLSGDRAEIVAHIARELKINAAHGCATARDKLDYVQRLQRGGAVVAMVGDGVNDAAGLAAAQVSIAVGGGADLACSAGDIVLLSGGLDRLLAAVRTARATWRVIRQNLAWAVAYNLTAIPLAACGYLSPLLAATGMAASSMLVVANSLRLLRNPHPHPGFERKGNGISLPPLQGEDRGGGG